MTEKNAKEIKSKRGGAREGAGRPRGRKNRKTQEIAMRAAEEGITPLEYLLNVMRNGEAPPTTRLDAAKAAAPYVHPRLNAMELSGAVGISHEDALNELE